MKGDRLLIRGAKVIDPINGTERIRDLFIKEGRFEKPGAFSIDESVQVIEAQGFCAAPGLVDMHVHLRDPGQTHKEDILTGCAAAAAGGVTSLAAMPNTVPPADNAGTISYELEKASRTGIRVYPVAAVTEGQKGKTLTDFEALSAAGAAAFSDDGHPVPEARIMAEAMKKAASLGKALISHCEDTGLAAGGIVNETAARKLGVKGIPAAAEEVQVARECALSESLGLPVHIAHVSTARSVAMIRDAKKRGARVTCETCPHYFSLDESLTYGRDADYRMNPPLRTLNDLRAVAEGLIDGTIDAIVTDHAPHTAAEKADFEKAPNGVVGLETLLAAGIAFLVKPGYLTLSGLIGKMTVSPAKILGIPAGSLEPGENADLILFDPEKRWTVDPDKLRSKSHNTPYKGMELYGRVALTICGGKTVFKL